MAFCYGSETILAVVVMVVSVVAVLCVCVLYVCMCLYVCVCIYMCVWIKGRSKTTWVKQRIVDKAK